VDKTDSGSCLTIGFTISGVQTSSFDTTVLDSKADDLHSGNHLRDLK
jgi:hypothetical protein